MCIHLQRIKLVNRLFFIIFVADINFYNDEEVTFNLDRCVDSIDNAGSVSRTRTSRHVKVAAIKRLRI